MSNFVDLSNAVIVGDKSGVKEITEILVEGGNDPLTIISEGLIRGMNTVGERFKTGEMFVPQVIMSSQAMSAGMALLKPLIVTKDIGNLGTVVFATVKGDLHDIGKKFVMTILESNGFNVVDLGTDISAEHIVNAIKIYHPQIVALSSLLTTSMLAMKSVIESIIVEGLRDEVRIIVGGAPLTQAFADEIGADAYGADAFEAAKLCKQYTGS